MSSFLSVINDKRVRDWFYQIALILLLVGLTVFFVRNASENMVKAGIASGFDFLWRTSGIEVPFVLTGYTQSDDIFALFWVGVANTMLVSVIAIFKGVVPLHNQLTILMASFQGIHGQQGVLQRLSSVEEQHAKLSAHVEQGIMPKLDDIARTVNEIRDR